MQAEHEIPWDDLDVTETKPRASFRRFLLPWALAISLWGTFPFINENYLLLTQHLGWYPAEADSIGIPIIGGYGLALFGAPVWLIYCAKRFRFLPNDQTCFAWAPEKWRQAPIRSTLLAVFILLALWSAISNIQLYQDTIRQLRPSYSYFAFCNAAGSVGWALMWLVLLNCVPPAS